MKSCEEVMMILATRKDLSPGQEQQLRAHLAECSGCTAQSQAEELTTRTLRLLRTPTSAVVERVVDGADQRIERVLVGQGRRRPAQQRAGLVLAGALLAVMLLALGIVTNALQPAPASRTGGPLDGTPGAAATATPAHQQGAAQPTYLPGPSQTPQEAQQPGTPATRADLEGGSQAQALAAQTLLFYYSAIDQRLYDIAYRHWADNGAASGLSLDEFQAGYQQTVRVSIILDAIRGPTADAQSIEVDVRILAVVDDLTVDETGQRLQVFSGTYTLESAGPDPHSATGWLIAGADIREISAALPPVEFQSAEQTLTTYYEAINQQDYALAYSAWEQLGQASGQSFAEFQAGFTATAEVTFEQGAAQTSAGAGNLYARIPVVVSARQTDGSQQAYCGFYDLHRANLPPFDQLGWRIQKADLIATDVVALNSEQSRHLLEGGCPGR